MLGNISRAFCFFSLRLQEVKEQFILYVNQLNELLPSANRTKLEQNPLQDAITRFHSTCSP